MTNTTKKNEPVWIRRARHDNKIMSHVFKEQLAEAVLYARRQGRLDEEIKKWMGILDEAGYHCENFQFEYTCEVFLQYSEEVTRK